MLTDRIVVDARGLVCPYVAVKTKRVLNEISAGATVVVLCTDPLAALDIPFLATGYGRAYAVGPDLGDHFEIEIGIQTGDPPSADMWPILDQD